MLRKELIFIKKTIIFLVLICFLLPSFSVSAGQGWYFKRGEGQPVCYGGEKWVTEKGALFMGRSGDKKVYLTFDAGYGNENVRAIAKTLMETDTTAAFFILPAFAETDGELIKALDEKGYFICNHSYSHRDMSGLSRDALKNEIEKAEKHLFEKTGVVMKKYFRPPEGTFSAQMLDNCNELGYKTVFWSNAYADWDNNNQKDPDWAYQKIMSSLHDGMVLLLHPNSSTNAAILPRLIEGIRKAGYEFGSLDQLYSSQYGEPTGSFIRGNPLADKCIALTFDDGPHPEYTPQILDILEEYGVKATFFVVGENASQHPDLVRRAIEAGHEIGNHTWSHKGMKSLSEKQISDEITKTHDFLKSTFDYSPVLFRPPGGGEYGNALKKTEEMGYKYVLWSWHTDPKDWKSPSAESITKAVLGTVEGGDIVLLHDYVSGVSSTPAALRQIIPSLLEQGYSFVTVSELLSQPSKLPTRQEQ
jgi:delta-lactam-biosynthetic de-N-acetylase